jgi:hypothetical protein
LSVSIRFPRGNPLSGASLFSMEGKIHVRAKGFDFVANGEHIQLIGMKDLQRWCKQRGHGEDARDLGRVSNIGPFHSAEEGYLPV